MTPEDMRATITEICRVQPSLLLHILDHCNGQPRLHPRANHLGVPAPIVGKCQQSKRECAATERLRTATPGYRYVYKDLDSISKNIFIITNSFYLNVKSAYC